jgi:hypothetical protein
MTTPGDAAQFEDADDDAPARNPKSVPDVPAPEPPRHSESTDDFSVSELDKVDDRATGHGTRVV